MIKRALIVARAAYKRQHPTRVMRLAKVPGGGVLWLIQRDNDGFSAALAESINPSGGRDFRLLASYGVF